jgi:hypothetical protein
MTSCASAPGEPTVFSVLRRRGAQRRLLTLALGMWLAADAALAAPVARPADPFLAQLAGRWDMIGAVRGKAVHHRGEGRWVLKGAWLCLSIVDAASPPAYTASVYLGFDRRQRDYIAHWLDQFGAAGARVVATGKREGQTLVLLFPYAEGAFRDTLSLAPDGASGTLLLESQAKDGGWSKFASYRLTRAR